jgi:hypothetical protein
MRFGKYTIMNEKTYEVLTRSSEHGMMTIEHLTEFVETDTSQFGWLETDVREAKKYLDKKLIKQVTENRFCSVCGVTAVTSADPDEDTCANCGTLSENVQRAFIALRSTLIEQNELIEELRNKVEQNR